MPFDSATRRKVIPLSVQSRPVGGGTLRWTLPRSGLAARIYLAIRGNVAGTLTAPNAQGMASIVRRVRLYLNSGIDVFSMSGVGYHYLFAGMSELESDEVPQAHIAVNGARAAVTATTFVLDMVIPLQLNQRDPAGLIMLQSEQTLVQLEIDFEADATVATGATVNATVTPYLEFFTVPVDRNDWPPLGIIHSVLEETRVVAAAGDFSYEWPRGNTYLQLIHGFGIGVPGSDLWTRARLRVQQSDNIFDLTPIAADMERAYTSFMTRLPGVIPFDLMGSAGMGMYDKMRDTINTAMLTDLETVITASAASTLWTVRRQLIKLNDQAAA